MKINRYLLFLLICFSTIENASGFDTERVGELKHLESYEIRTSPWGIQFTAMRPHVDIEIEPDEWPVYELRIRTLLDQAGNLGVKWARVSFNWITVQDEDGQYQWNYPDVVLNGLVERGITPYVCFHGGHPGFTDNLPPTESQSGMQAWLRFVSAVVERYAGIIDYWELWNEPNYPSFWKPRPDARAYAELVKKTSPLIKKLDPGATVIGGSTARVDINFAKDILAFGAGPFIDVFTVHPYNAQPEGSWNKIVYPVKTPEYYLRSSNSMRELKQILQSQPQPIVLWQGECGYPAAAHSLGWQGAGPWGEQIQAKWLLRRLLIDVCEGLPVSSYFMLTNVVDHKGRINHKGLLRQQNFEPKPAFFALQNLCTTIQGKVAVDSAAFKMDIVAQGGFYGLEGKDLTAYKLKTTNGKVYVYWAVWPIQEHIQPGKISLKAEIKDPVCIDLLSGKIYTADTEQLCLYDYPVVIGSRSEIEQLMKK